MLVLTRHSGQSVYVGDSIVVTVVKVRGQKVRLAFEAPQGVRIDREEVHARRRQWQASPATVEIVLADPVSARLDSRELPSDSTGQPSAFVIEGAT